MNNEKVKTMSRHLSMRRYIAYLILILSTLIGISWFSSCEKEIGSGDQKGGRPTEVRFSVVAGGFSGEETLARSASNEGNVLATTSLPLSDGWYMDAELMEDPASSLRAEYRDLIDGAKFRMVAFLGADGSVPLENKVCTYDAATRALTIDGGAPFSLVNGSSYSFAVYSYNTTTAPPTYNGSYVTPVSTDPAAAVNCDLIWGRSGAITVNGTEDNKADIAIAHKFTRVRVNTIVTGGTNPVITNIAASIQSNYDGNLTVATGAISKGSLSAQTVLGWPNPLNSNSATSDYQLIHTAGDNPVNISITALNISDVDPVNSLANLLPLPVKFTKVLGGGKSYLLQLNIKKTGFAGSNIYWDAATQRLTFKPAGYKGDENYYQGVYFRWGSLVGISATSETYSSAIAIYVPDYNSGAPESSAWRKSTPAAEGKWGGIWATGGTTYVTPSVVGTQPSQNTYLMDPAQNTDAMYNDHLGDICQYIGKTTTDPNLKGYRMAIIGELLGGGGYFTDGTANALGWYLGRNEANTLPAVFAVPTFSTIDDGTSIFNYDARVGFATYKGAIFPAGGYRDSYPSEVGSKGISWSGSVHDDISAWYIGFVASEIYRNNNPLSKGFPVRCIKAN
jgi:hypothetical protein